MIRIPVQAKDFPPFRYAQTGSGVNGYRGSFSWVKRPGREADHLFPSSCEVKREWSYTFPPLHHFTIHAEDVQAVGLFRSNF